MQSPIAEFLKHFDLVISLMGKTSKISNSLLLYTKNLITVDPKPPKKFSGHASQFIWEQVDSAITLSPFEIPYLPVIPGQHEFANRWLADNRIENSRPLIALHPGSGSLDKNWDAKNFAKLIEDLFEVYPQHHVLLIEGESDSVAVQEVASITGAPTTTAKNLNLGQVAGLLSKCCLFIGNNSGISHLSAMLRVSTLVIFTFSNDTVWRPLGKTVRCTRTRVYNRGIIVQSH